MTPEGSEPLDELPSSEEDHSAAPSSSSSSKNVQIRVKNVSEINSNEAEANPSPPNKRKLPSWMLLSTQQPQSANNKKRKTVSNPIENASTSIASQPECIVSDSTSASGIQDDTEHNNSTSNAETSAGGDPVEHGEIIATADNESVEAEASVAPSASDSPIASTSDGQGSSTSAAAIKAEPAGEEDNEAVGIITPTSTRGIKPAVKVEKGEATSSTTRPTCRFGIRCYRQNPSHRREEAHPGDKDYKRPDFPAPPDGTPDCPYGNLCYRRNPVHFRQYSHPPSNFDQNYKNYKMRLRKRQQPANAPNVSNSDLDDDDEYDFEDPFINDDSEDEFIPNSMDYNEDDDDDF